MQDEVRPIGARALKSAIDTLRPQLNGARVLDLFAGQGRFGQQALVEGAEQVTFVEKNAVQLASLKKATLRSGEKAVVVGRDVFDYLKGPRPDSFDLVFADPPFPLWDPAFTQKLFTALAPWFSEGGIFLVKYPARVVACSPLPGYSLWKNTEIGESRLLYFFYAEGKKN